MPKKANTKKLTELVAVPRPPLTPDDIANGRVGKGVDPPFGDEQYRQAIYEKNRKDRIALQEAKREIELQGAKAKEELFLQHAKEMLPEVTKLRQMAMLIGSQIADRLISGEEVTQAEVQLFKKSLDEANRAEERVLGKSKAITESTTKHDFFAAILNVHKDGRG